jgi:hypothetical protein
MIDKHTLEEVIEILETPIQRPNLNDGDEEECRACRRRWYVQGPKQTAPRHEEHCMLLILLAILSPLDAKPACSRDHWDGDGREVPCLDPDKMHGAGDGFPGGDYA